MHLGRNDELISTASLVQPPANELLRFSAVRGIHRCGIYLGGVDEVPAFACKW